MNLGKLVRLNRLLAHPAGRFCSVEMMSAVRAAGARGATIGRNVWGLPTITEAFNAFKGVIHDGLSPSPAMQAAGL